MEGYKGIISVVPHNVIGTQCTANDGQVKVLAEDPTALPSCCIVDALPRAALEAGPRSIADDHIYEWLGISKWSAFPKPVRDAIGEKDGYAKYHRYRYFDSTKAPASIHVIHATHAVVDKNDEMTRMVEVVSKAYGRIFKEFIGSGRQTLRLPPIAAGASLTAAALGCAFAQHIDSQEQDLLLTYTDIQLCVEDPDECSAYQEALFGACVQQAKTASAVTSSKQSASASLQECDHATGDGDNILQPIEFEVIRGYGGDPLFSTNVLQDEATNSSKKKQYQSHTEMELPAPFEGPPGQDALSTIAAAVLEDPSTKKEIRDYRDHFNFDGTQSMPHISHGTLLDTLPRPTAYDPVTYEARPNVDPCPSSLRSLALLPPPPPPQSQPSMAPHLLDEAKVSEAKLRAQKEFDHYLAEQDAAIQAVLQQRQSGDKADTTVPSQQEGTAQKTIETRATLAARLATKLDERLVPAKVEHLFPGAGDDAQPQANQKEPKRRSTSPNKARESTYARKNHRYFSSLKAKNSKSNLSRSSAKIITEDASSSSASDHPVLMRCREDRARALAEEKAVAVDNFAKLLYETMHKAGLTVTQLFRLADTGGSRKKSTGMRAKTGADNTRKMSSRKMTLTTGEETSDGVLDPSEFYALVRNGLGMSQTELGHDDLKRIFRTMDSDGNGTVNCAELYVFVKRGRQLCDKDKLARKRQARTQKKAEEVKRNEENRSGEVGEKIESSIGNGARRRQKCKPAIPRQKHDAKAPSISEVTKERRNEVHGKEKTKKAPAEGEISVTDRFALVLWKALERKQTHASAAAESLRAAALKETQRIKNDIAALEEEINDISSGNKAQKTEASRDDTCGADLLVELRSRKSGLKWQLKCSQGNEKLAEDAIEKAKGIMTHHGLKILIPIPAGSSQQNVADGQRCMTFEQFDGPFLCQLGLQAEEKDRFSLSDRRASFDSMASSYMRAAKGRDATLLTASADSPPEFATDVAIKRGLSVRLLAPSAAAISFLSSERGQIASAASTAAALKLHTKKEDVNTANTCQSLNKSSLDSRSTPKNVEDNNVDKVETTQVAVATSEDVINFLVRGRNVMRSKDTERAAIAANRRVQNFHKNKLGGKTLAEVVSGEVSARFLMSVSRANRNEMTHTAAVLYARGMDVAFNRSVSLSELIEPPVRVVKLGLLAILGTAKQTRPENSGNCDDDDDDDKDEDLRPVSFEHFEWIVRRRLLVPDNHISQELLMRVFVHLLEESPHCDLNMKDSYIKGATTTRQVRDFVWKGKPKVHPNRPYRAEDFEAAMRAAQKRISEHRCSSLEVAVKADREARSSHYRRHFRPPVPRQPRQKDVHRYHPFEECRRIKDGLDDDKVARQLALEVEVARQKTLFTYAPIPPMEINLGNDVKGDCYEGYNGYGTKALIGQTHSRQPLLHASSCSSDMAADHFKLLNHAFDPIDPGTFLPSSVGSAATTATIKHSLVGAENAPIVSESINDPVAFSTTVVEIDHGQPTSAETGSVEHQEVYAVAPRHPLSILQNVSVGRHAKPPQRKAINPNTILLTPAQVAEQQATRDASTPVILPSERKDPLGRNAALYHRGHGYGRLHREDASLALDDAELEQIMSDSQCLTDKGWSSGFEADFNADTRSVRAKFTHPDSNLPPFRCSQDCLRFGGAK